MKTLYQAHIGLTTQCNLCCPHCYSIKERLKNGDTNMSLTTLEKILTRLKSLQTFKIIFAYSESLLYKDFFQAMRLTNNFGFDIELTTNAIELSKEVIEKLNEFGVNKIQISLDYPDIRHDHFRNYPGLFQKVKDALILLKENGNFRTRVLSTQWDDDISFYKAFQQLADQYSIDVVAFLSAEKFPKEKKERIKKIISEMEKDKRFTFHSPYFTPERCFVGQIVHINPWGNFTLCPLANKIMGNILTISDEALSDVLEKSIKLACLHNPEINHEKK